MLQDNGLFIDGEWTAATGGAPALTVVSPLTEQNIGEVQSASAGDADRAVQAARTAFDEGPWPQMSGPERAAVLRRMAAAYRDRAESVAQTVTAEMGSPITLSRTIHSVRPSEMLDFYADIAESYGFEQVRAGRNGDAIVRSEPVGVVAAIVPWNYPQTGAMLKVAPALASGSTVVLKPSKDTPVDAQVFGEVAAEAGLPAGVLNIVSSGPGVGDALVRHDGVDKVSFTGSTEVGAGIASACGLAIRRVSLELGGKSAAIVLADADLDRAVPGIIASSYANTGQTCTAQTRVLVARSRYREFVDAFGAAAAALPLGDPFDAATRLGPLVSARQRETVRGYIDVGRGEGARLVTGGNDAAVPDTGWFVAPTVFSDVDPGMRVAQEEIFGPVIVVIPFDDDAEAIRIANDSQYGLSGAAWSEDLDRALRVARGVRTGQYLINGASAGLIAPIGGFKKSGIGREFGVEGFQAYLEIKSISVPSGYLSVAGAGA